MRNRAPEFKNFPLQIVGGNKYGRYSKISVQETVNMIVSDDWLVPYAGFNFVEVLNANGIGRAIYKSSKNNKMYAVVGSSVFEIPPSLSASVIGTLATSNGDVFIAEDNQGNIAFCDKTAIYIYNPTDPLFIPNFQKLNAAAVNFTPGYICFHDSRFISVDLASSQWRLSDPRAANRTFPFDAQHVGAFQTKPDIPIAVFPFPGRSNTICILGSTVGQFWTDQGLALFPYVLNTGVSCDYGTANSDTVANIDDLVCWLGINDRSGPVILVSKGGPPEKISNDGIDFKLASLRNPLDSHGFMFKQDGHIFYQLVFPTDNFSITYDFNTNLFFTVTDTYLNYHPAKRVAFFNNTYFFVSLNDGNLYQMSTNDTTYDQNMIPRIRICPTFRMPDTAPFVVNNLDFPIEQGVDSPALNPANYPLTLIRTEADDNIITTQNNVMLRTETNYFAFLNNGHGMLPAVDLAISMDGGYTFSNFDRMQLNPLGYRKNRFIYYNCGWSNEFTPQFRMWSTGRIVAGNGTFSVYQ